jgi:hypothetical protein
LGVLPDLLVRSETELSTMLLNMSTSLRNILISLLLLFLFLGTSRAIYHEEFFRVHDYVHAARIVEMTEAVTDGHFPVRWSKNFGFGYGMPLFEFYAPLPYYIGSFFYWLSGNLLWSVKLLFLLANLASVVGSYLLGKELYGRKGGVIVATAYSLAPYRAVNLFVRGAVSESWGMAAMPFVLWAGIRFFKTVHWQNTKKNSKQLASKLANSNQRSWWILVVSLFTLFLSHNLSTLMFLPISLVVVGVIGWTTIAKHKVNKVKVFGKWLAGYVLAIGLAAFYLFPAFLEKDFTIIDQILSGYFHFSHHFLYIRQFLIPNWGYGGSAWGPDDGISFFLGYGQMAAVALSLLLIRAAGMKKRRMTTKSSEFKFSDLSVMVKVLKSSHLLHFILFGLVTVGALYLSLLKSEWLWQILPLISFIQFPWRWLSIAILFTSLMAGYGMILVTNPKSLKIVIVGLISLMILNLQYFQPQSYLDRAEDFYYQDQQLIRTQMSGVLPDYIPQQLEITSLQKETEDDQNKPTTQGLSANKTGSVLLMSDNQPDHQVLVDRTHQKLVQISLPAEKAITFAVANYPGWQAELDGEAYSTSTSADGLIEVLVPAGDHKLGIYLDSTKVRYWSDLVSAASLIAAIYILISVPKKSQSS